MGFPILVRWHLYIESGPSGGRCVSLPWRHHMYSSSWTYKWRDFLYTQRSGGLYFQPISYWRSKLILSNNMQNGFDDALKCHRKSFGHLVHFSCTFVHSTQHQKSWKTHNLIQSIVWEVVAFKCMQFQKMCADCNFPRAGLLQYRISPQSSCKKKTSRKLYRS